MLHSARHSTVTELAAGATRIPSKTCGLYDGQKRLGRTSKGVRGRNDTTVAARQHGAEGGTGQIWACSTFVDVPVPNDAEEGFFDYVAERPARAGRRKNPATPLRMTTSGVAPRIRATPDGHACSLGRKSSAKSLHVGLVESIKAIFFARSQPLICFSRAIAARMSPNFSQYTRRVTLYVFVKPSTIFWRC